MRARTITAMAIALAMAITGPAWGRGPGVTNPRPHVGGAPTNNTGTPIQQFIVVSERRGLEVNCQEFSYPDQVTSYVNRLQSEAVDTKKSNAEAKRDIEGLKEAAAKLKAAIAHETDETKKAALQEELTTTEANIKDRETQLQPVVVWVVSPTFNNEQDAAAYMAQVEKEAKAAKDRAEKAQAEKDKAGK